jgi:hypothetical protein
MRRYDEKRRHLPNLAYVELVAEEKKPLRHQKRASICTSSRMNDLAKRLLSPLRLLSLFSFTYKKDAKN